MRSYHIFCVLVIYGHAKPTIGGLEIYLARLEFDSASLTSNSHCAGPLLPRTCILSYNLGRKL